MQRSLRPGDARAVLRDRADLGAGGWTDRDLRRALASGSVRRIQRNQYVTAEDWESLWPESKHLVEVVAAAREMRGGPGAMAYASAGVSHALPLYRYRPSRVEMTGGRTHRASSRGGLLRHHEELVDDDIVEIDGMLCTSLERTVFDLARTLPWEAAVAVADAALRRVSVSERVLDAAAAEEWRERMRIRVNAAQGRRGVRQAARVIEFADGRAELPGESVSRVQLARLGYAGIELQVPVGSPTGGTYEVDLGLRGARTFWEFDGKGKYLDEAKRSGKTLEQVLLEEKRREDWIRGVTQWRFCRGGDADIVTPQTLASRLAAFGVPAP
jgi:hypothetical protein